MTARLVYGEDERLIQWAAARGAGTKFREDAKAIGLERRGSVAAVVVFDTFSSNSCLVHLASDGSRRWMTRAFMIAAMAFPFIQCGFRRIECQISERNADSLRFTRHFGWVEEGRQREGAPDGADLIMFGMLRRECRYLPATGAKAASGL